MNEREDMNQVEDTYRDLAGQIREIDQYYQSLSIEVDNRALNLTAVDCRTSLDGGDQPLAPSSGCPVAVNEAWDWLQSAASCLQKHLSNAASYHQFFHELRHQERNLQDIFTRVKQLDINRYNPGKHEEFIRNLIQDIKDLLQSLLDAQSKVDQLFDQSANVVPVHLRKLPLEAALPVVALISYDQHQIKIQENESCVLLDNSNPTSWKVKTNQGVSAFLPSLIFVIPPPDKDAVQAASRLCHQLISTWQSSASVLKFFSRTLFSQYHCSCDAKELSYLNDQERRIVVDCLDEAVSLLSNDDVQENDIRNFQTMMDGWKKSVATLKPSSSVGDKRNIVTKLQGDWLANKKLLRKILEFEAFLTSCGENISSKRESKQRLVNVGDFSGLKYVSVAYIERWPREDSHTLENGHLIMAEKGPVYKGRYVSQVEADLEEVTSETVSEEKEVTEVTSQTIQETNRFMIRGVIDPRTNKEISIYQAIADKVINHLQGLYLNPITGENISIPEAMDRGLILVDYVNRSVEMGELIKSGIIRTITTKETISYHVLSIKDPLTGQRISVNEALKRGIIDAESGRYIINAKTGESMSIPTAIDKGLLEVEVIERRPAAELGFVDNNIDEGVYHRQDLLVEGVYDPVSRSKVTLDEAIAKGIVDLEKGMYTSPATKQSTSIEEAIQRGFLTVRLTSPASSDAVDSYLGQRMMAVNGGQGLGGLGDIVARKADLLGAPLQVNIEQKLRSASGLETKYIKNPSTGKKMSVADAVAAGIITVDPLSFKLPDGSRCTIQEASQKGLIDPATVKEILKSLEPYSLQNLISDGLIDPRSGEYIDPVTGNRMPLSQAVALGQLDPAGVFYIDPLSRSVLSLKTAIKNNKFDLESGKFIDPLTGKKLTMAEAAAKNLIGPDVNADEFSARLSSAKLLGPLFQSNTKGVKNPQTKEEMSLEDAILDGILDVGTGEYVHPLTKQRLSMAEAVSMGLLDQETAKKVLDAMSQSTLEGLVSQSQVDLTTGKFIDPVSKQKITFKEAIEKGLLDPATVFVASQTDNRPVSLQTLIREGRFNPETGKLRDPTSGQEVSIATAASQGTFATRFESDEYIDGKKALKDLLDSRKFNQQSANFVLPNGESVPLKEAMADGLVSSETAVKVDRATGNVILADDSNAVVQMLIDTKSHLDWLNGIESKVAQQAPLSDDVNQLQQLISVNEELKKNLESKRNAIADVTTSAMKLVDEDRGSVQQNQRLKCNTTDLRLRYDKANNLVSSKLDQLKEMTREVVKLNDACNKLNGWTEEGSLKLDKCKKEMLTVNDFSPIKKQIEAFGEELQREDQQLRSLKTSAQTVNDSMKVYGKETKKYLDELENMNAVLTGNDTSVAEDEELTRTVDAMLASVEDKLQKLGNDFSNLSSGLDQLASKEEQYNQTKDDLDETLQALEGKVDECHRQPSDEKELAEAMDRVKDATMEVLKAGKQVKELKDRGEGLIQSLEAMDLKNSPKAAEIEKNLNKVQGRFDFVNETVAERQRELSKAVVQSQDVQQNLTALLKWVGDSESYLDGLKPVSLDRTKLSTQVQEHRMFSSELENHQPQVSAVVEQCQAQGRGDIVGELLDRFDLLRSKNDVRGQELEDVIQKLTSLHASVDQLESWLTSAVLSLKRSNADQSTLKAKIENLYVQKRGKQGDLEQIKTIGRELIEDPTTGDKHQLRETIADTQSKWQDLTELLVQMISYSALMEIDDLLKYLDRAENEMNTADAISIDPEALAVQLRDHKAFHEDLKNKRKVVKGTIDKCNEMLLETMNEEADDIKHKLNIIRDQADLVYRLSNERCSLLEEALPLVSHFCDTRSDLQSWLNEMEAEVNSMEVDFDGTADQIKKQLENSKATLRIIDDHKTLMQDLLTTGHDLIDICGEEDGLEIQNDLQETMNKYNDIKVITRHKMTILKDKLKSSTTELNDCIENAAEELYYITDQIQFMDPISIKPPFIHDQITECQAVEEDFDRCSTGLESLRMNLSRLIDQDPNGSADEYKELDSRLQELSALQDGIRDKCGSRSIKLDETLAVADRFQQDYIVAMQSLQGIKDNLLSQDVAGIDPTTVKEQHKELQAIQDEMLAVGPLLDICRKTADQLGSVSGGPAAVELEKQLDEMDKLVEFIADGITDRDADLAAALEKSENCSKYQDLVMSWLPRSEDQLKRMSPVAKDARSMGSQAEELKQFKAKALEHHSDLMNLNHFASALKNSSPITAGSLMGEVKEANDRWNHLLAGIAERERMLSLKLADSGEVGLVMDGVMESLMSSQLQLMEMESVRTDGKNLENSLKTLQVLQNDLSNQEPVIQRLNDAVLKGAPLDDKCQEMNDLYATVQVMARDKQNGLQDHLKEFKGFMGKVEELTRWLNDYRGALLSCPPLAALPDTAEQQLTDFMNAYEELEKKESDVKAVLTHADDLWGQDLEKDNKVIKETLSRLQDRTYGTREKAERRKGKMERHLQTVQEFHGLLSLHSDWLNNAEKVLGSFKHPSKLVDRVIQQISEHQVFRESLEEHATMMYQIEHMGAFLKHFGGRQDNIYIQTLLMTIKVRWKKLVRRVDDKGRLLNHAYQEDKKFYDEWKSICDWLDANEQRLKKYSPATPAKLKQDIDDLQHLQQQMSARQAPYHSASRLGRNLKDRCTKSDPEREILNGMLEELKSKWNSLRSVITQRQSKLDQSLLSSGRFSDAISSLMEWLTKAEGYLLEDQPVLGDLDTVTILIEHHKAFQQEIGSRQAMVDAIQSSVSNDPSVSAQLDDLNHLWEHVNQLSDTRDYKLQESLRLAEDFQEVVQVVREWLPQAEVELKFRAMPEDEDSLVQLLENHERFQEELRAQQPNIEKIVTMADEILQACHPSAVRFVRYYLTITQTRWEQAVNRSNQRMQRLQEALRNIRGNAALLEDLLTWLTEAHALLTAKEKDLIPDDLTVVEVLVKEHMEFHEDLCQKNRDVERLTKAPPSNSRLQLHGSAWKLHELDVMSPRVISLQNKWRTVWRISVDRKKRLQDMLDQLLELESFKNFDFDNWRTRYIDWIKSKKLRVTDFFRRQDKNGFGTLTRDQFVSGMLIAKFPTNRTELNAVFDIFDRNRSGEIQYSEFIEALRPERQHGGRRPAGRGQTHADLIHDEVEQQLSHCQCRHQFYGERLGEGKYKFGEKGKLCLMRFLNSTVMVRVGGGWVTLSSFLDNNDPCRAKGRLNTDLREIASIPEATPLPPTRSTGTPKRSTPGVPAMNNRLSGSTSSLTSIGKATATKGGGKSSGLASKRSTNMAKSCTNLSTSGLAKTPETGRLTSTPKRPSTSQTTPRAAAAVGKPPSSSSSFSSTSSSRVNGNSNGRFTPTPTASGRKTPTMSKTPTGSRTASPTRSSRQPTPVDRNAQLSSSKQGRF